MGLVNVSAADKATGKEQNIRIEASGGLSDDDIDQMVKDAEANATADKERREGVEARNNAEGLIHATEKSISENQEIVEAADQEAAEAAIVALKAALEGDDNDAIREKAEALSQAAMKIGEAVYAAQQAENDAAAEAAGEEGADGNVVDADFEDVTEEESAESAEGDEGDNDQKAS